MTLSDTLATISASGWLVRNLCQLADGRWYACLWLHNDDGWYETPSAIGFAPDPSSALILAYQAIPSARFIPYAVPGAEHIEPIPKLSLADLGLLPKPPPLPRRPLT